MGEPAPYTGRTSEPVSAASAVPAPRIRWGRIAIVHLAAAFLAGLVFPLALSGGDPQWILIGLISGFVVALVGGGVTLGGAALGFSLATRGSRGWGRETLGVAIGALAGSGLIGVLLIAFVGVYGLAIVAIAGIGSAVGLAIWVLVAWAPHLQHRPVR